MNALTYPQKCFIESMPGAERWECTYNHHQKFSCGYWPKCKERTWTF